MFKPFNQKLEELDLTEHSENIRLTSSHPIQLKLFRLHFGPMHLMIILKT